MGFTERYRVEPGSKVRLEAWDSDDTGSLHDKTDAEARLAENVERLDKLQYLLYAEGKRALLVVFQAMDAGGKDGCIRHVMGPVNPQGCRVTSFKAPTRAELAHDFLWRVHQATPGKGEIGVFNRSHYEDVLIVRAREMVPKSVWRDRYDHINAFERLLADSGVHILKFYLHISKDEQLERFRKRLENPRKHWKANPKDFEERKLWDRYMAAYEDALSKCSTEHAPWFIVPANKKWFRNVLVSQVIVETLERLDMKLPEADFDISTIKIE